MVGRRGQRRRILAAGAGNRPPRPLRGAGFIGSHLVERLLQKGKQVYVVDSMEGRPITVHGSGEQRRSFCHVSDTLDAVEGLLESPGAVGGVFNIGDEEEITILELAERVKERTGSDSPIELVPHDEAYGEGFEDMERRQPDTTRIRELLGWTPEKTLDDMIEDVVAHHGEKAPAA